MKQDNKNIIEIIVIMNSKNPGKTSGNNIFVIKKIIKINELWKKVNEKTSEVIWFKAPNPFVCNNWFIE